ncbi:MAG: hypothetical protein LC790_16265, partial [Actinobacteria bacterium]|nr:hypothetical protein [Actinomycetota bacterium]
MTPTPAERLLIRAAASGRTQGFGVTVSAPVSYEAREFVSYLFGRLCVRVLGPRVAQERVQAARDARVQAAALTAAVLLVLIGLMLAAYTVAGSGDAPVGTEFLVVAGVSLGVAALATSMLPRVARQRRRRGESPLIEAAWANLDRLRYLETQTQEWSSELAAKGAKFGAKRGVSRAAQTLTLPELIDA